MKEQEFIDFLQKNKINNVYATGYFVIEVPTNRCILKVDTDDARVLRELGNYYPYAIIVGKSMSVENLVQIYSNGKLYTFSDVLKDIITRYGIEAIYGEDVRCLERVSEGTIYISGTNDVNALYELLSLFYDFTLDLQVKFLSMHGDTPLVQLYERGVA